MSVESFLFFISSRNSLLDPWSAFPKVYNHKTEMVLGVHVSVYVCVCVLVCSCVCVCVCVCVKVQVDCGLLQAAWNLGKHAVVKTNKKINNRFSRSSAC